MLRQAIREIRQLPGLRIRAISPIYESAAMLPAGAREAWNQPFLNLAISLEPEDGSKLILSPRLFLERIKEIEKRLGRVESERWAPRPIDIDILSWNDEAYRDERLTIPHAGLLERPFALLPLRDLDPEFRHHRRLCDQGARELASHWRFAADADVPFQTRITSTYLLPELMGTLNLTPDSFSDGGRFEEPGRAVEQVRSLVQAGATVIDLGAESTRPGAAPVDAETEWRRIERVLRPIQEALAPFPAVQLSVDTRHAPTAARALQAGITWLNDVSGFDSPGMAALAAAETGATLVVMHSLGVPPQATRVLPPHRDPIEELLTWGEGKLAMLDKLGISRERVILDPGIGFGKTARQSIEILNQVDRLKALGTRVLVGHSRKSFLRELSNRPAEDRDLETSVVSTHLARHGVDYIRVHDVASNLRALRTAFSLDGVIRWTRK